jgi:hypothetical protein
MIGQYFRVIEPVLKRGNVEDAKPKKKNAKSGTTPSTKKLWTVSTVSLIVINSLRITFVLYEIRNLKGLLEKRNRYLAEHGKTLHETRPQEGVEVEIDEHQVASVIDENDLAAQVAPPPLESVETTEKPAETEFIEVKINKSQQERNESEEIPVKSSIFSNSTSLNTKTQIRSSKLLITEINAEESKNQELKSEQNEVNFIVFI